MREDGRDLPQHGELFYGRDNYRKMMEYAVSSECKACKAILSCSRKRSNGNYAVNTEKTEKFFSFNTDAVHHHITTIFRREHEVVQ